MVYETLQELGVTGKPIITVLNKWDRIEQDPEAYRDRLPAKDPKAKKTVRTSALSSDIIGK